MKTLKHKKCGILRDAQDRYTLESQQRTAAAQAALMPRSLSLPPP